MTPLPRNYAAQAQAQAQLCATARPVRACPQHAFVPAVPMFHFGIFPTKHSTHTFSQNSPATTPIPLRGVTTTKEPRTGGGVGREPCFARREGGLNFKNQRLPSLRLPESLGVCKFVITGWMRRGRRRRVVRIHRDHGKLCMCVCSVYYQPNPSRRGGPCHGPQLAAFSGLWAIPSTESGSPPNHFWSPTTYLLLR
jgi:hypothetical protein